MKPLQFRQLKQSIINNPRTPTKCSPAEHSPAKHSPFKSPLRFQEQEHQVLSFQKIKDFRTRADRQPLSGQKGLRDLNSENAFTLNYGSDKKKDACFAFKHKLNDFIVKDSQSVGTQKAGFNKQIKINKGTEQVKKSSRRNSNTHDQSSLSFTNLLQSKMVVTRNPPETDRGCERESSLSKLKQQLFGMKKVISNRQATPKNKQKHPSQNQQERKTKILESGTDFVNISLDKSVVFDMSPGLR